MNILFTICGRAGSKGFKNKNLKYLCGTPLVYYTLSVICLYIKRYSQKTNIYIVLNTDSADLIKIVLLQNFLEVDVINRDEKLGEDTVPKVKVINDCLMQMENRHNCKFDVVVDLDITSPLRTVKNVKQAIDKKMERKDIDVVYSVTNSRRNPFFNMVKQEKGLFVKAIKANYTARQQAPNFYDMNASIYAYNPSALRNKDTNTFFNDNADAIIMRDTAVLDIDSEEDYELMQVIAAYLFETDSELQEVYLFAKNMSSIQK